jgi:hypothetical protein
MTPPTYELLNAEYDALPPQQQLAGLLKKIAYIESLRVEDAPTLTLCAQPDDRPTDILELTITGTELLADFQQLLLGRLEIMRAKAVAALPANCIPAGCTTSEMDMGNGIIVTIVHRSEAPLIARSEAEVVLD